MKKVYIETYGCSANQAESEIMEGILHDAGYAISQNEEDADIIVINTCSVKDKTEHKIMYRLGELKGKKLIIAGCLPEAELDRVRKRAPGASIVSTNHIKKIAIAADMLLNDDQTVFVGKTKEEKVGLRKISHNPVVDIIPISSGCLSSCSYCSTKLAKGALFSYQAEHIVDEIKSAKIGAGAKEFWLTSQDCGCFGFENGKNAADLIKQITKNVPGRYFLRFGMANPQHVKRFLPELIDAYKDERVFKFIHIPVQSGSDSVLNDMARGHSVDDFLHVIAEFRKAFPEITVWTDVIIGFPTETEDDFQKTIELIKKVRPDVVNISAFSARPGTRAAKMKQLTTEVKKERTRIISEVAKQIYLEKNKAWIGWTGEAIVDEFHEKNRNWIARNSAYKPIVLAGDYDPGQIIEVEIKDANENCLFASSRI